MRRARYCSSQLWAAVFAIVAISCIASSTGNEAGKSSGKGSNAGNKAAVKAPSKAKPSAGSKVVEEAPESKKSSPVHQKLKKISKSEEPVGEAKSENEESVVTVAKVKPKGKSESSEKAPRKEGDDEIGSGTSTNESKPKVKTSTRKSTKRNTKKSHGSSSKKNSRGVAESEKNGSKKNHEKSSVTKEKEQTAEVKASKDSSDAGSGGGEATGGGGVDKKKEDEVAAWTAAAKELRVRAAQTVPDGCYSWGGDGDSSKRKTKIALLVPSKSTSDMEHMEASPVLNVLLPSIRRTVLNDEKENFEFILYVGYDEGDTLYDNPGNLQRLTSLVEEAKGSLPLTLRTKRIGARVITPVLCWNVLFNLAYAEGNDYFFQLNDDIEFLSNGWASILTNYLATNPVYKNFGMTGPADVNNADNLMTQSMTSRLHFEIFGYYYPPKFQNWFSDDWAHQVYGRRNTFQNNAVQVRNTQPKGTRYYVDRFGKDTLEQERSIGRALLTRWLREKLKKVLPSAIKAQSSCPQAPRLGSDKPSRQFDVSGLVIATLGTSPDFDNIRNLVGSVHSFEPDMKVVIYNIGMKAEQRKEALTWQNVLVRELLSDKLPEHVSKLSTKAFRPAVIKDAVDEFGSVVAMNPSMEVLESLNEVRDVMSRLGYLLVQPAGFCSAIKCCRPYLAHTHADTIRKLGVEGNPDGVNDDTIMVAEMIQGYVKGSPGYDALLEMHKCAMDVTCIAPADANPKSHSFDRSVLSTVAFKRNMHIQCHPRFLFDPTSMNLDAPPASPGIYCPNTNPVFSKNQPNRMYSKFVQVISRGAAVHSELWKGT